MNLSTANRTTIDAPLSSAPAQGWPNTFLLISTASTNGTSIKTTPGTLGLAAITGGTGTVGDGYLKIYDTALTTGVVGVLTPKIVIPSYSGGSASFPLNVISPAAGIRFSSGIYIAVVAGVANSSTTAVGAGSFVVNLAYA